MGCATLRDGRHNVVVGHRGKLKAAALAIEVSGGGGDASGDVL